MRLSDLHNGNKGVIIKVTGHGAFRKRIVEMGFIKGKEVEVLLNAPLQDPVKYRIMGYEVSLRRAEAEMIEVILLEESTDISSETTPYEGYLNKEIKINQPTAPINKQDLNTVLKRKSKHINIALVGNPNCGKTSLFNFASGAHERVGNYSGVTVDAKEGIAHYKGYEFHLTDLPGTYSLSAYSPEELYVRKQLTDEMPDIVINVIDASNLERNLYLTTQLMEMNIQMVCALNMFDETERRGDNIDYKELGKKLNMPVTPTVFKSGKGVHSLFESVINVYENEYDKESSDTLSTDYKPVIYGEELEQGIQTLQQLLLPHETLHRYSSTRYLAIKLLEGDKDVENQLESIKDKQEIINARNQLTQAIKCHKHEDCETIIMDTKYGFIRHLLQEIDYKQGKKQDIYQLTRRIDAIITNKWVGFPLFIAILWLMFQTTFSLGQYPMDWIEAGVNIIGENVSNYLPDGSLKAMTVDGIIGGVGAVIVFLPQILILYAFISFMEDSGYMARTAFIMDKLMHKMGLHGKSFIPLIMGFGCNVPAIMSTRTIESRRSRLVTMLILPLMSCSARLPVYIMIIGTFFAPKYRSSVMISLYIIGILMAVIMSKLFISTLAKGEDTPFVMELPPYRFPTWKAMGRHTWEKGKQYLKKMGGFILMASIIVWALGYFPYGESLSSDKRLEKSYIGQIGKTIEPIFKAQGFDWKLDVGLLAGTAAKEVVASTMGVIYTSDNSFSDDDSYSQDTVKYSKLYKQMHADGITPISAYAFLLFVLLYFPCIATIAAIKGETGSWKWALFASVYTTALAWGVSAAFYQIASHII
jgi:ferrous iron transport protein B